MKNLHLLQKQICCVILFAIGFTARANIFPVTAAADSGPGTLREAIMAVDASPLTSIADPYIIDMSPIDGGLITLASSLPEIKNFVRIIAATNVTVSCQSLYRAFFTQDPLITVWFKNLTVAKAKNAFTNMGSSIFLERCTVNGCSAPNAAPNGGGMFTNGYAELSHCTFNGCSAINGGGGNICNYQDGILILKDSCEIFRGTAQTGGGIFSYGKLQIMDGALINRNTATTSGGGIYISSINSSDINLLIGAQIINNSAPAAGGLYAGTNTDILNNTIISRNNATGGNGGGIYIHTGANANFDNTFIQVSNNTASMHGGGIFMESNAQTKFLTNVEIENNESINGNGGGVYLTDGFIVFNGCNIKSNKANLHGGGIYSGAILFLTSTQCSDNRATTQNGGALYMNNTNATINTGCSFTNNKALLGKGAAVYNGTGLLSITGTAFTGNSADDGAVVYSVAGYANPVTFEGCSFTNNTSRNLGCLMSENGAMQMNNCTFTSNRGLFDVTKIIDRVGYRWDGKYNITNSFLQGNTDMYLAFLTSDAEFSIANSTVLDYTGIMQLQNGNFNLSNSLFNNNERFQADLNYGHISLLKCTFQNYKRGVFYLSGRDTAYNFSADSCIFQNNADTVVSVAGSRSISNSGVVCVNACNASFGHCFFTGNSSWAGSGEGGALVCYRGSNPGVFVSNSTFSNNHAANTGGAVQTYANARLNISNCTFSGNAAAANGGAIDCSRFALGGNGIGRLTINSSAFVLNTITSSSSGALGGAIYNDSNIVDISNTIIAGNTRGGGITDDIASGSRIRSQYKKNLFTSLNAPIAGGAYNTVSSAAEVVNTTLNFNGGYTPTHLLAINSPAIDFCLNETTPVTDQRGVTRDLFPDCGSVEGSFASPGGGSGGGGKLIAKTNSNISLKVWPNPASDKIHVAYNSLKAEKNALSIIDVNGTMIFQSHQQIIAGSNIIVIDISKYAAGSYIFDIVNTDRERHSLSFIKQ